MPETGREPQPGLFTSLRLQERGGQGKGPGLTVGGCSEAPERGRHISHSDGTACAPRVPHGSCAGAFRGDSATRCPSRPGGWESLPESREHLHTERGGRLKVTGKCQDNGHGERRAETPRCTGADSGTYRWVAPRVGARQ